MGNLDLFGAVSTVDDGVRSDFDFYETPAFMVHSLLHHHPAIAGRSVLEPCAGRGAIARVLAESYHCRVTTNDLNPAHAAERGMDATLPLLWHVCGWPAWVISNPPFTVALPILQHAVETATVGVAMLLRKTFLEPTDARGPWLMAHPPTRIIGQPRYAFRGKGSDSVSCDWCVWERQPNRKLPPIVIDYGAESRRRVNA